MYEYRFARDQFCEFEAWVEPVEQEQGYYLAKIIKGERVFTATDINPQVALGIAFLKLSQWLTAAGRTSDTDSD